MIRNVLSIAATLAVYAPAAWLMWKLELANHARIVDRHAGEK